MSLGFDQIQATLNSLDAILDPVQSPVKARHVFLKRRQPHLDVVQVVFHAPQPLVDTAQVAEYEVVRIFAHTAGYSVTAPFCH